MKDIATKSTTQYILDKYDLYPKKKYGQNFLIDPHVVEKIVRCSSVNEKCAVIEVGPGIGALTQVLARYAGYVRSYEIDTRFKGVYEEFLNQENIFYNEPRNQPVLPPLAPVFSLTPDYNFQFSSLTIHSQSFAIATVLPHECPASAVGTTPAVSVLHCPG